MIEVLNTDQVRFVAILAKAARSQRDEMLRRIKEQELAEVTAGRGEHNPTTMLGLEPVDSDATPRAALQDAIASVPPEARAELFTLMRIGQGHLAAKKWHRGITDARLLGDDTISAALLEDADLHDHLLKGLYEANLAA